jgi:hypothetical protein
MRKKIDMLKNIHLGHSPLTDMIYVGHLKKDKQTWRDKVDVTNDFLAAVISRWSGYKQIIHGNGKRYEITVREISKNANEEIAT